MSYLLKSRPKKENKWKLITILIIFCSLSLLAYLFPKFTRDSSLAISKPLWMARIGITDSFSKVKGYFSTKNDIIAENEELKEEVIRLKMKEIDYATVSKEFEDLKNQVGQVQGSPIRVVSRVLSKPPLSPFDSFIIDVGSVDGITMGSRVYISENIIIGLVKNITPHTSLVELFSTGDREQEVTLSRTGASYILTGHGGANLEVEVPKDADIVWGDVFLYPKFSPSMIGSVYYVDTNSQSSFKNIYVRVPGNIFATKYVFIEKNVID